MAETPRLGMTDPLGPRNLDYSAGALPPGAECVHFYLIRRVRLVAPNTLTSASHKMAAALDTR